MERDVKGEVIIGQLPNGELYTSPLRQTDPHSPDMQSLAPAEKAKSRYTFEYEKNTKGELVIASITNDGTLVQQAKEDLGRGAISDMQVNRLEQPRAIMVNGVEFAVGGSPAGVIQDEELAMSPESQKLFDRMESDFIHSQEKFQVPHHELARLDITRSHRELVDSEQGVAQDPVREIEVQER